MRNFTLKVNGCLITMMITINDPLGTTIGPPRHYYRPSEQNYLREPKVDLPPFYERDNVEKYLNWKMINFLSTTKYIKEKGCPWLP